jgi:DNA-binding response OmpR family regulator/HPt (histidine-containing phosphotransfer) domain-containing protein
MRILVVEDDEILQSLLKQRLSAEHYAIDSASDGLKGWEYASTYDYDLLILDLVLPKLDGISLCQKLRKAGYTLPILILTSQDTSTAKIMGLDAGADDYVVKPFDEPELIARVRALLRRGSTNPLPIVTCGDLHLNSSTHEVSYGTTVLNLTAKEYALLEMMMRESQHVFSNEEILESLWSSEEFPVDATVRSHLRRLRQKLTTVGAPPDLIATSHGRGYYLKFVQPPVEPNPAKSNPAKPVTSKPVTSKSVTSKPVTSKPVPSQPSDEAAQQDQYLELLNQTWQNHRSGCLDRLQTIQSALDHLQSGQLTSTLQVEAYRVAHTLVGTLGTFGLQEAMQLSRKIDQELHPDLHVEADQVTHLRSLLQQLHQHIETTHTIQTLPNLSNDRPKTPSQPKLRLMLVDDDPIFLKTFSPQLQHYGFQVSTVNHPKEFWPLLERIAPDVLVLDVQMPDTNGLSLCQSLRASPNWQRLPVIFLSSATDPKTQNEAFAAGADDYLCKPMSAQTLNDRIHQRLQRIQAIVKI